MNAHTMPRVAALLLASSLASSLQAVWDALGVRDDGVQKAEEDRQLSVLHGAASKARVGMQVTASGEVTTHSIICSIDIDIDLFNEWITKLLKDRGDTIFRTKARAEQRDAHPRMCHLAVVFACSKLSSRCPSHPTLPKPTPQGILSARGYKQKFVWQSVHMIFDGSLAGEWQEGEARVSRMVLIGVRFDGRALSRQFHECARAT